MKLKHITASIIAINVLMLFQEIPWNVIILTISSLVLSIIVTGKKLRAAFKIFLLSIGLGVLRYHFKTLMVTECAVSLALILSSLKFWELESESDHFSMFLILCLCECCVFLLNPLFLIFFFGIVKMLFYFYYILKIRNYDISALNFKRLTLLVLPSLIFSLVLFYTFPRFTSGFINTSDLQYIISGGSSKIDFKDLGPLTLSSETAFKVYGLEKSQLPFKILYWRTAVLWQMTNNEWSASNNNLKYPVNTTTAGKLNYDVEVATTFKEYMPTLDGQSSIISANQNYNSYSDRSFRIKAISRGNLSYSVSGNYGDRPIEYNSLMEKKGLTLKSSQTEEIRSKFFATSSTSADDEARLKELIQIFKSQNFQYSTTPPKYLSLEDFLLNAKLGYCSHFAAAFIYLARLQNLPSRLVTGYLGGEVNPYDGSVIVKELDAHAWVEVYIKKKGWIKIDPTVLVVPERATMSTEEFNSKLNPYISVLNFQIDRDLFKFSAINNISLWIDSLNSKFNSSIFNFDREKQLSFLRSLVPTRLSIGWIFLSSLITFMFIFWAIFYVYGKTKISPAKKQYLRFLKRMQSHGLFKEDSETITAFSIRCKSLFPHESDHIDSEVAHYINNFYK